MHGGSRAGISSGRLPLLYLYRKGCYVIMEKNHQDAAWVPHAEIEPEVCGKGVKRRILAYSKDAMCVENTFETGGVGAMHCHPHTQITYIVSGRYRFTIGDETREVGPGDTLLKQNGVMHGCVCLEGGVMLDFFTPMREDFV